MGVPAFFRWLSMKYPMIIVDCVEEVGWHQTGEEVAIDASQANPNGQEFDNLYLDMNGIIHPCTHPEDRPAPTTEEEMFQEVFRYCDRIFDIVRPRKLLYMAIDGVAPRAKINQQRSRRFRSAKEAVDKQAENEKLRKEWIEANLILPDEKEHTPFDSNVITPGTPFMSRLSIALRQYVKDRYEANPAWKDVKVVFSDASVPGEGEHKIAEYIRQSRAQPSYSPNTSHVLYGLDADLIMLALATHELHFSILRECVMDAQGKMNVEAVKGPKDKLEDLHPGGELRGYLSEFGGKKPFQFLHVHILREYLDFEFREALEEGFGRVAKEKRTAPMRYDFERVIDDFVFTCFFVGNDFLPHLPSLDIREGALDYLIELYKSSVPELGYLTDGYGKVDTSKVKQILKDVGETEDEVFRKRSEQERRDAERQERNRNENRKRARAGQVDRDKSQREAAEDLGMAALGKTGFNAYKPQKKSRTDNGGTEVTNADVAEALRARFNKAAGEQTDAPAGAETQGSDAQEPKEKTAAELLKEKYSDLSGSSLDAALKDELSQRMKEKNTIKDPVDSIRLGEEGWKDRYYSKKLHWDVHSEEGQEGKRKLCLSYIEGLLWVMDYYYNGCVSWNWYFPYHYAPFASDLAQLELTKDSIKFELATPYSPLEQLMSVLPAVSAKGVLPDPFYDLMVKKDSPIRHYYPEDFELDLNGKKFAWQGVALLPFVEEKLLMSALEPAKAKLSQRERERNNTGRTLLLVKRSNVLGEFIESKLFGKEPVDKLSIDGKDVTDGVVFLEAEVAKDEVQTDHAVVVIGELPLPLRQHNPRPNPGSEKPTPTVTEAEFSYVRQGSTGWKPAKFGSLGQAAKRLRDSRRIFGASDGYSNYNNNHGNGQYMGRGRSGNRGGYDRGHSRDNRRNDWNQNQYNGGDGYQGYQGHRGRQGNNAQQGYDGYQGRQGGQYQSQGGQMGNQYYQGGYQGYQANQGGQDYQGNQGGQGYRGNQGYQRNQGYHDNQGYQGNQGGIKADRGNRGYQGYQQNYSGYQGGQGGYQNYQDQTSLSGYQPAQGYQGYQRNNSGQEYGSQQQMSDRSGNQNQQNQASARGLAGPTAAAMRRNYGGKPQNVGRPAYGSESAGGLNMGGARSGYNPPLSTAPPAPRTQLSGASAMMDLSAPAPGLANKPSPKSQQARGSGNYPAYATMNPGDGFPAGGGYGESAAPPARGGYGQGQNRGNYNNRGHNSGGRR